MDSKYASISAENAKSANKRKHILSINKLNIKKAKTPLNATHIKISPNNGDINVKKSDHEVEKTAISEDLQEARKKLPVYAVRNRYAYQVSVLQLTKSTIPYSFLITID